MVEKETEMNPIIDALFKVGAHLAYGKSRRHPSAAPFIFGSKSRVEIFDLTETSLLLESAKVFVRSLAEKGKQILFVGGKSEAKEAIQAAAQSIEMPYVAGRFIGGSITNFPQIRKRIEKFERLIGERERRELGKYTKKERLLIDRDIKTLEKNFGGIVSMKSLPGALFVIDSKRERIAVAEAKKAGIPLISLSNSDCDLKLIDHPIPGNDSSRASIEFFLNEITSAYQEGKKTATPVV